MTVSDRSRHQLHPGSASLLGADEAATLMEHLPPVGWADAATKRDLDHLAAAVRADIAGLRAEVHDAFGRLRDDLRGRNRTIFLGLIGLQVTGATLAVVLSRVL